MCLTMYFFRIKLSEWSLYVDAQLYVKNCTNFSFILKIQILTRMENILKGQINSLGGLEFHNGSLLKVYREIC